MAYNYPLNNSGGVHLTVCDFTHLSHTPNYEGDYDQGANDAIYSLCTVQAVSDLCEPAGSDEPHTARLLVSQSMTPQDVVTRILQIQR